MEKATYGKTGTCVICNRAYNDYGNNPLPISKEGRCCRSCNMTHVVPARIGTLPKKNWPLLQPKKRK